MELKGKGSGSCMLSLLAGRRQLWSEAASFI